MKDTFLARGYMDDVLVFSTEGGQAARAPQLLDECYTCPAKAGGCG